MFRFCLTLGEFWRGVTCAFLPLVLQAFNFLRKIDGIQADPGMRLIMSFRVIIGGLDRIGLHIFGGNVDDVSEGRCMGQRWKALSQGFHGVGIWWL